jgi:hypothetical protein
MRVTPLLIRHLTRQKNPHMSVAESAYKRWMMWKESYRSRIASSSPPKTSRLLEDSQDNIYYSIHFCSVVLSLSNIVNSIHRDSSAIFAGFTALFHMHHSQSAPRNFTD